MVPRLRVAALALASLLAAQAAGAQPARSVYVIPFGGYTLFDEELRLSGHKLENDPYMGGRLGVQLVPWLALEAAGGFVSTELDTAVGPKIKFTHLSGNLVLTPWRTSRGGLFWSEGFGWGRLKSEGGAKDSDIDQGLLESALGAEIDFTPRIGLRLEGRHLFWLPKTDIQKAHIKYWVLGGGLVFNFGGGGHAVDSDNDGVPDSRDRCPNTPLGAKVDANGCPQDDDADAVPNGIDQCPNTPHGCRVDAKGCPIDSDGDGVCDGLDRCEGTPAGAKVDATGCPTDSDGDGVPDGIDQCPDTPRGTPVDERGCPRVTDSDHDGVPDDRDKCPNTPAGLKVDADGCPIEVNERETELLDTGMIRMNDVHFATAKWDIQPEDMPRLDVVGQVLERWPQLRIEIGGHTDSRGSVAYNHALSHKRANSVLQYLLQHFPSLKSSQYTVKGYGEDRPIATNRTVEGMARNRRVEFKVLNREVLKREVERRRLLRKQEGAPPDSTR